MSSSITVGSFYNTKSPLHSLDPRVKMVIMVVYMVSVFLAPAPWGLIPVAAMLVLATCLSHVPSCGRPSSRCGSSSSSR